MPQTEKCIRRRHSLGCNFQALRTGRRWSRKGGQLVPKYFCHFLLSAGLLFCLILVLRHQRYEDSTCLTQRNGGRKAGAELQQFTAQFSLLGSARSQNTSSPRPVTSHTTNQNSFYHARVSSQFSISHFFLVDLEGRKPAGVLLKDANLILPLTWLNSLWRFPLGFQSLNLIHLGERRIYYNLHFYEGPLCCFFPTLSQEVLTGKLSIENCRFGAIEQ